MSVISARLVRTDKTNIPFLPMLSSKLFLPVSMCFLVSTYVLSVISARLVSCTDTTRSSCALCSASICFTMFSANSGDGGYEDDVDNGDDDYDHAGS